MTNTADIDGSIESTRPRKAGPEKLWNESQFIWWSDRNSNLGGFHRIAHQPNNNNAHNWNIIILDDGRYTRRNDDKVSYEDWMRADGRFSVPGVSFEFLEPGKILIKVDQDGYKAELIFEDIYDSVPLEAYVSEEIRKGMLSEMNTAHFEVSGTIKGFVEFEGQRTEVDAFGHRDHSWGERKTHAIQTSHWFNGTVGPEYSMFLSNCAFFDGNHIQLGYIIENGTLTAVKDWHFRPLMDLDGVTHTGGSGWFETVDGRIFDLECDGLVSGAIVNLGEWVGFEGMLEYSAKERNTSTAPYKGRFVLERCINSCGGLRFPGFIVNGANENNTGTMLKASR